MNIPILKKEIILSDMPRHKTYRSHFQNTNLDNSQSNLLSNSQMLNTTVLDKHSLHSLKPVLYSQQQDQNETIMIDDIMSNYSTNLRNKNGTNRSHLSPADRMRQELSSEDIYTLKFTSNGPIEPFDVNAPKQHQSYLYNGSMNRPAFEIVSNADVRPTTPVRFEQARDLAHSDDEFIYSDRHHNQNYKHRKFLFC